MGAGLAPELRRAGAWECADMTYSTLLTERTGPVLKITPTGPRC